MSGKSPEKGETEFLLGVGVGMGGIAQQVSAVDYHRLPVPKMVPGPMPIQCIVGLGDIADKTQKLSKTIPDGWIPM